MATTTQTSATSADPCECCGETPVVSVACCDDVPIPRDDLWFILEYLSGVGVCFPDFSSDIDPDFTADPVRALPLVYLGVGTAITGDPNVHRWATAEQWDGQPVGYLYCASNGGWGYASPLVTSPFSDPSDVSSCDPFYLEKSSKGGSPDCPGTTFRMAVSETPP